MGIKKIIAFILILAIAITLCSCKSRSNVDDEPQQRGTREVSAPPETPKPQPKPASRPESKPADEVITITYDLTDDFFQAARTGERGLIQEYADYNTLFGLIEGQDADWILQQILMRMKYEIFSSEMAGDNADKMLVSVKCSNVDMDIVMPLYFEQAMSLEYNNALSASPMDAAGLEREYRRIFAALMSSNGECRIEKLIDIELNKDGDIWKVKPEAAVGNAMLGGYHEARDKFMQAAAAHDAEFQQPEPARDETSGDDGYAYDTGYIDHGGENSDAYANYDEFSMVPPRE